MRVQTAYGWAGEVSNKKLGLCSVPGVFCFLNVCFHHSTLFFPSYLHLIAVPPHLVVTARFISGVYISRIWDFFILILGERKGEGGRLNRSNPRRARKLLARHPQKITSQSLLAHIGSPVYPWTNPVELGIVKWSGSVVSHSLRPHRQQPTRFRCPWGFLGKNTGVGCHFLLQGIFPTQGLNPGLLHCRQSLYHLSYQGTPNSLRRSHRSLSQISFPQALGLCKSSWANKS